LHRRHTAKRTALSLLARAFQPKALLARTLDRTISREIRAQDAPFIVSAILGNAYDRELAWGFVKTNWERMEQLLAKQGLRRMCCAFVSLATQKLERDVREFFAAPQVDPGGTTLDQYLGQLRIAVKMRQRDGKQLSAYLHAGLPLGRGFGFGRECPKAASGDAGKVIRAL
jgi:hypothetical protein